MKGRFRLGALSAESTPALPVPTRLRPIGDEAMIARAILRDADERLELLRVLPSALALLLVQRAHRRAAVERGGYD